MKTITLHSAIASVAGALALAAPVVQAQALPGSPPGQNFEPQGSRRSDLAHPLGQRLRALREQGIEAKLAGKAHGKVHEVAKGQFVELERTGEDSIWTVLGEFKDLPHNGIEEPDRASDRATIWAPDFSRDYYLELLFSEAPGAISMRNFYIEQSSNRYAVNGDVTEWVTVPGEATSYDDLGLASLQGATQVWQFLQDSVDGWYAAQIAAGKTDEEINEYLAQFDVWDRYDSDGDGNFDEPDGYIDHFQAVHSGEGEEIGGGALGEQAIWSHRWYAYFPGLPGEVYPDNTGPLGGVRVGNSPYYVGDYTIEPENGGVGVFAHEFAHDLDLPDLYDTSGLGENSTSFWTLMSQGSYGNDGTVDIGSKPTHMGAWEKLMLGWLNYELAFAGGKSEHKLGPAETNTKQAQGLIVVLPPKTVVSELVEPFEGDYFYYSGQGDGLSNALLRDFTLPAGATLSAEVNFDIEFGYDFAYLIVSQDGGNSWAPVETNLGYELTGKSGGWIELTADLAAFGGDVLLAFVYETDQFLTKPGFRIDAIEVSGYPLDGAELDNSTWKLLGFTIEESLGGETSTHGNYYIAEYRQYRGFDESLKTGPYNSGFLEIVEGMVTNQFELERYPFQDGLLVSYWDTSQADNNTSEHPGAGLILPIDAHPAALVRDRGFAPGVWRNRIQAFDSTFSREPTDELTLHWFGEAFTYPSQPGVPVFDDRKQYWNDEIPTAGVDQPRTGTQIRIKSVSARGGFMQVQVSPAK